MPQAERLSKKSTVRREGKLRGQLRNFEDNLSAERIIPASRKGSIYFITLRLNSQGERTQIVPSYFFAFPGTELSTSSFILRSLASEKQHFVLFSMTN